MSEVAMGTAKPCEIHKTHSPKTILQDMHHVVPDAWWADPKVPPVGSRLVVVCATGHRSTHYYIDQLVRGNQVSSTCAEAKLAREAIKVALAAGLTPKPTL